MTHRRKLIDCARELVPVLRERAADAERLRTLPAETQRDLLDAGLYRIYLPRRYGGDELDYQLHVDIAGELGRGCGSTAWVWSIVESHHWVHGMMDVRAQDDVWADDPDALIASAFPTPGASVREVDGGLEIDGTWSFASGVDVCRWLHLNLFVSGRHFFGLVPVAEVEIVDDWFVAGLKGTGSKSIRARNLFVPEYRILESAACVGGPTRGSAVNPGPLFRMPLFSLFAHGIAGPALGIARGALDAVLGPLRERRSRGGVALAEQATVLVRVAEAAAEIDAAHAMLKLASDEATAAAEAGLVPPLTDRVRWRRNGAYAATLSMRAVQRLQPLAGANGLREDTPLQRALRDVQAVCSHVALNWDLQAANAGGVLLGLPSTDPKL